MSDYATNGAVEVEKAMDAAEESFKTVEANMSKMFENVDMAVPEAVRKMAEQTVNQSREAYEKAKDAMEDTVGVLEQSIDKAGQGAVAWNRKVIDLAQTNLNTSFDFAKELAGAKNVAELMELQSKFARSQFETLTSQAEEVRTLATKIATDTTSPMKEHVTQSFDKAMAS